MVHKKAAYNTFSKIVYLFSHSFDSLHRLWFCEIILLSLRYYLSSRQSLFAAIQRLIWDYKYPGIESYEIIINPNKARHLTRPRPLLQEPHICKYLLPSVRFICSKFCFLIKTASASPESVCLLNGALKGNIFSFQFSISEK